MSNKILICISNLGAAIQLWKSNRLQGYQAFTADHEGVLAFSDYLASLGNYPVHFMVDAVEEDYRFETLPHSSGSDKNQMVERKLRQYYRSSHYCAATKIGRSNQERRDDHYLFAALTNRDILTPWLTEATELGLPIGGIYLLPTVINTLMQKTEQKPDNLLVVGHNNTGVRLTFFRKGYFDSAG